MAWISLGIYSTGIKKTDVVSVLVEIVFELTNLEFQWIIAVIKDDLLRCELNKSMAAVVRKTQKFLSSVSLLMLQTFIGQCRKVIVH